MTTSVGGMRGFTLLELLVAMAIFAIVSVLAMGGLNTILTQQDRAKAQLERLHAIQRAVRIISADLAQANPRWVRDERGDPSPSISTQSIDCRDIVLLCLTRDGWRNPFALQARGTLQRVQYRLDKDQLIREYWRTVERSATESPRKQILLDKVDSAEFLFPPANDRDTQWSPQWPPLRAPNGQAIGGRPKAVIVKLTLSDWGLLQRYIEVPQ